MLASASVAARVNGERLVLLSWPRAILLQLAHPLIAAGVAEHSGFRGSALSAARRLHSTTRAMLGLTFGTEVERQRVVTHILGIHRRVNGHLRQTTGRFPAGTRYSAEDPDLVLWVHATLLDSTTTAFRALVGELTVADVDRYCAEAAPIAVALGAREAEVPRSASELATYTAAVVGSGTLAVGDQAKAVAAAVLSGSLPRALAPAGWLSRLVTAAWMPADLRPAFDLRWDARRQAHFERVAAWLAATRRVTPDAIARWPESHRTPT